MIRKWLDKMHPLFAKGGKLEKLYPLYEAQDTFLYTPGEVAEGSTHVRDALDLKRMMSMVIVALVPCIFFAMFNTGHQANLVIQAADTAATAAGQNYAPEGWRYAVLDTLGVDYRSAGTFSQDLANPSRALACLLHGALFFFPVYIVGLAAGGLCEAIFAIVRGHEINEGFLVTSMLFPLTLPPQIPLWQVAVGIIFGVVIGKEVFGGTGMNFLNPALTARAFLYFAHAGQMSGTNVWTGVDGYSGATALGALASGAKTSELVDMTGKVTVGTDTIADAIPNGLTWWQAFLGDMHGSMGETSTLACLIGAIILIASGIGSWRIMVGCLVGMTAFSGLLNLAAGYSPDNSMLAVGPQWHLVLGGFAFGTVFMATDPVSASMTNLGKWIYGALIGFMTVVVRCINPAFPEGIMLAILFGNIFAPLIDYFVMQANIKRRLAYNAA
ncbi:MAG: NADH:ubiquinone reductase (Na(+)-transporting) subunit B [Planctomycetales bacterium]|nr:NADH:ubiquinone reductase (Na(+)-transporting) subunit B [Planctomycetales bacterium]